MFKCVVVLFTLTIVFCQSSRVALAYAGLATAQQGVANQQAAKQECFALRSQTPVAFDSQTNAWRFDVTVQALAPLVPNEIDLSAFSVVSQSLNSNQTPNRTNPLAVVLPQTQAVSQTMHIVFDVERTWLTKDKEDFWNSLASDVLITRFQSNLSKIQCNCACEEPQVKAGVSDVLSIDKLSGALTCMASDPNSGMRIDTINPADNISNDEKSNLWVIVRGLQADVEAAKLNESDWFDKMTQRYGLYADVSQQLKTGRVLLIILEADNNELKGPIDLVNGYIMGRSEPPEGFHPPQINTQLFHLSTNRMATVGTPPQTTIRNEEVQKILNIIDKSYYIRVPLAFTQLISSADLNKVSLSLTYDNDKTCNVIPLKLDFGDSMPSPQRDGVFLPVIVWLPWAIYTGLLCVLMLLISLFMYVFDIFMLRTVLDSYWTLPWHHSDDS